PDHRQPADDQKRCSQQTRVRLLVSAIGEDDRRTDDVLLVHGYPFDIPSAAPFPRPRGRGVTRMELSRIVTIAANEHAVDLIDSQCAQRPGPDGLDAVRASLRNGHVMCGSGYWQEPDPESVKFPDPGSLTNCQS